MGERPPLEDLKHKPSKIRIYRYNYQERRGLREG